MGSLWGIDNRFDSCERLTVLFYKGVNGLNFRYHKPSLHPGKLTSQLKKGDNFQRIQLQRCRVFNMFKPRGYATRPANIIDGGFLTKLNL